MRQIFNNKTCSSFSFFFMEFNSVDKTIETCTILLSFNYKSELVYLLLLLPLFL